jgi:hypothetical protein
MGFFGLNGSIAALAINLALASMINAVGIGFQRGIHIALRATLSRGCPGEPDDPICQTSAFANPSEPLDARQAGAFQALGDAPNTGQTADMQFSLYVMGARDHMAATHWPR